MINNITSEVMAMNEISFRGNVTPPNWYKHLRYDSDRANLNAITILSEIVYWYRPSEVRDESTGDLVGYKKKFKADKLQRSYQSFSDQFGITKKQVRDAIAFLEDKRLITKELRTIVTEGITLSNVLFIGIVPAQIKTITLQVTPMTCKSDPPNIEVRPSQHRSHTYTETTTENTSDINGSAKNPQTSSSDILEPSALANGICTLCVLGETISKDKRQEVKDATITLHPENITQPDLNNFKAWWYDHTWKGQRNQSPEPKDICNEWGRFEAARVVNVPVTPDGDGGVYI